MKEEKKEETIDRRIRKTRRLLRECLTALLKEKKVQDITVREIADMADINRGTFYLHYKDVFDLMEQIENGLLKELEDMIDEKALDRTKAIILSMTPKERSNPGILNISRKNRIARGAGVDIAEVNRLVKQFEQSKKMMKQMPGLMGGKGGKRGKFKLPF